MLHSTKKLNEDDIKDESENSSILSGEEKEKDGKRTQSKILHPFEVVQHIKLFWQENSSLLDLLFGNYICTPETLSAPGPGYRVIKFDPASFFLTALPITPNRFRPENKLGDSTYLHPHTVMLQKIMTINAELKKAMLLTKEKNEAFELKETFAKWIELQDAVNGLFDSTKCGKVTQEGDAGIKQLLEKKEGMLRMKIMGKRVNYAARSVISPDPLLDTNEVGVPLFVAKKLTFPEAVNEANLDKLKSLIRNGASTWPGALYLSEGGHKISLEGSTPEQREALCKNLLTNAENKIVYRHVLDGDVLLFNRQPTLHRPSLMSHIARVLPKEHTIRMHYANCSSYNADFDGDEMNLHLLQNHLARAEAYNLCLSDKQYIVPTDNSPIRGLIQDIILSSVFLTMKGAFFSKAEYHQLVYSSLKTMVEKEGVLRRIKTVPPCIMRPVKLWTGKQIVTTIINIVAERHEGDQFAEKLFMQNKTRINEKFLSSIDKEEKQVLIKNNELLAGILDKASLGESNFGLIHCFYELTDSKRTGKLLSALSRLFCNYLQMHGFTCGLDDLITKPIFEEFRRNTLRDIHNGALQAQAKLVGLKDFKVPENFNLFGRPLYDQAPSKRIKEVFKREPGKDYSEIGNDLSKGIERKRMDEKNASALIDTTIKQSLSSKHSEVNDRAVTSGLKKHFPENCFSVMVLSGAKGTVLNHNQISCMLGQQELEGQRVPIMASGKTLPSFIPYDPNPRAGGYIGDRFLTGLRTQEFFFHCMAGREGLIDTAVKTSRSGYLQRILIKNLESLIVQYDYTVRENDGSIVQFLYGEDCLDPTKVNAIEKIGFLADNFHSFNQNPNIQEIKAKLEADEAKTWREKALSEPDNYKFRTIMSELNPGTNFGSISIKAEAALEEFIKSDPRFSSSAEGAKSLNKKKFRNLFYAKYFETFAVPGEAVGVIAGQSIGEPSTQMTLNTFHLAGHGGANMTLGVPRLKELLTNKNTKTPAMVLKFKDPSINKLKAKQISRLLMKVSLNELLKEITVVEQKTILDHESTPLAPERRYRTYSICFNFEEMKAIKFAFGFTVNSIEDTLKNVFKPRLTKTLMKILHKKQKQGDKKATEAGITNYDLENLKMKRGQGESENQTENNIAELSEYADAEDTNVQTEIDADVADINKDDGEESSTDESDGMIKDFEFQGGKCKFKIRLPLNADKLLMLQ